MKKFILKLVMALMPFILYAVETVRWEIERDTKYRDDLLKYTLGNILLRSRESYTLKKVLDICVQLQKIFKAVEGKLCLWRLRCRKVS